MYTGRLEVTLDNVYSVLLATHLLHMPGALEQCRAALLRLRAPPPLPMPILVSAGPTSTLTSTMSTSTPGSGNILRPIPNRLMIDPSMCWPPATPLYPTAPAPAPTSIGIPHMPQLQPSVLMQSTVPINVSVVPTSSVQETQSSTSYREVPSPKSSLFQIDRNRGLRMDSRAKSPESTTTMPFAAAAFTAFTSNAATSTRASSPSQSVSPTLSSTSQSSLPACQKSEQRQVKEETDYEQRNSSGNQAQNRSSPVTSVEETSSTRDRSVESVSMGESDRQRSSRRKGRGSSSRNDGSSSGVLSVVYDVACCDGPVKFHRVLNKNYSSSAPSPVLQPRLQRSCFETENVSTENDENGGPAAVRSCDPIRSDIDAANTSGSYTCGYCRHTFKSQYCYRKHTKRHLLPTRVNETVVNNRPRQDTARSRREVRLLDLNVQYYPCKICGCKFPSYYFVHKHRKLCHANAEERPQEEASSTAAEDQGSNTSSNERQ
nr:PREDICTED: A-agglutinin anchorage subunit isoform X2 [Megachile rotundata]